MNKCKYGNGYTGTKLYNIWCMMKRRCNNKTHPAYKWYGARGIKVCDEWNDSTPFREWALSNGYEEGLELDRIDNNGNYEPDNCQWVTHKENTACGKRRNTRNNSGFVGVWQEKRDGRWRSEILIDGSRKKLGTYKTFEEAKNSRIEAEIKYFGERKTYMDT